MGRKPPCDTHGPRHPARDGDGDAVTAELEREGVQSFCDSYHQLLDCIEGKLGALSPAAHRQPM